MDPLSFPKKVIFALLPTILVLAAVEVGLRWKGSADRCPGYRDGDSVLWACDPILYFRNNPNEIIAGAPLNSRGFRGPEMGPARVGVTQVLALGDSSTFGVISPDDFNGLRFIDEPYPARLGVLADSRFGPGRVEVLNAGVPGYNSWHGIMLLRSSLRDLRPGVVTVRFGWNDLAVRKRQAGENAFVESDNVVVRFFEDLLLHTKLYPFARRLGMEAKARLAPVTSGPGQFPAAWTPSIPIDQFERNLRRIVELGRSRGAEVWLLTSPDPFSTPEDLERYDRRPKTSSAQFTLAMNGVSSFKRLAEIHAEYNAAVRRVAAATGSPLVDHEAAFRERSSESLFTLGDVIHPNDAGHQLEAENLFARLGKVLSR